MMDTHPEPHYSVSEIPAVIEQHTGETRNLHTVRWHMKPKDKGGSGRLVPDFYDLAGKPRFYLSTILRFHESIQMGRPRKARIDRAATTRRKAK